MAMGTDWEAAATVGAVAETQAMAVGTDWEAAATVGAVVETTAAAERDRVSEVTVGAVAVAVATD